MVWTSITYRRYGELDGNYAQPATGYHWEVIQGHPMGCYAVKGGVAQTHAEAARDADYARVRYLQAN